MELTDETRKRIEANRLAALAKRKALTESTENQQQDPWRLFKCKKVATTDAPKLGSTASIDQEPRTHLPEKYRARLEICSPDSFSVTPAAVKGFPYPGADQCLHRLSDILSEVIPSHYTQNHGGGKSCVFKLRDYSPVLACLKRALSDVEVEEIPWVTLSVIEKLSHSFDIGRWEPCRPEHLYDKDVDELIEKLPKKLLDALLPFQLDGLRFGLQRGARCLIADEMGLGKTLQAIAIAGCFVHEGPVLVVCPAVLRFSWAEELERWLPFCLPSDIHLVFGHQNNPAYLTRCPKVVVTSYTMLHHLKRTMLEQKWSLLIVDESHHVRCSKKKSESQEIQAVLDVAEKVKHIVLLSGTPSLSRPGLLGKDKYQFGKTYCDVKYIRGPQDKYFQDFSKGIRLEELNVLLKQTVMIRRLKEHVLMQLPPKRRQIISLVLKKSDIVSAKAAAIEARGHIPKQDATECTGSEDLNGSDNVAVNDVDNDAFEHNVAEDTDIDPDEPEAGKDSCTYKELSNQELGIAKLSGFCEWLSLHPLITESESTAELDSHTSSHKMIIFGHHLKVLDGVQEFLCEKGIGFVRIDGSTLARDRQLAVLSFRSSDEIKIAIIGIEAGGVGLDFSSAQSVVFLELPKTPSLMLQAEDRAHRRGQTGAVNIYIFYAKDTMDEPRWRNLNKSLHRVSSTTNGKYDAVHEIEIEDVCYLEAHDRGRVPAKLDRLQIPDFSLAPNMQSSEAYDNEVIAATSCRCEEKGGGTLNLAMLDSSYESMAFALVATSDLAIEKVHLSVEEAEVIVPEAETGHLSAVSPNKLDEGNEQARKPEKANVTSHQLHEDGLVQPMEADCSSSLVSSLRFEVSQYTGRIHLYTCTPGTDSRPMPLFENFRPEELESRNPSPANKDITSESLKDNPVYKHGLLAFIEQWNRLRPIEQRKLLGKPLQLPLSVELCYLRESINHNRKGLIRGGSKRRTTPLNEISFPLPLDATLKKVCLRNGFNGKEKEYTQGWSLSNEPLCKLCQKPCKGRSAKEPEYFEDLFCNLDCFEDYRLRTSNRFLRQELFEIERGICSNCRLDCHQLVKRIKPLSLERRRNYVQKVAPMLASRSNLLDKLVNDPTEGNAWHADHIIPVYRGGGECRLENMRTLCVACHCDVTAAQCVERRVTRVRARKQLKTTLKNHKNIEKANKSRANIKGNEVSPEVHDEEVDDDELLVVVPGSAYSGDKNTQT